MSTSPQPIVGHGPRYHPGLVAAVATVAAAAGSVGAFRLGWPIALAYVAMILVAVGAAVVDARSLRLPDLCTCGLIAGGVATLLAAEFAGAKSVLVVGLLGGALYGGGLLVIGLIQPQATGLGDIKLAAGLGVWLAGASLEHLLIGVVAGQLILLIWARLDLRIHGSPREIPAGPALVAGAIVALLVA